jgi:hypothetical protein
MSAALAGKSLEARSAMIENIEKHCAENGVDVAQGLRMSPLLEFDAAAERFTGDQADHANSLLRREYRKPFEVPTVA